MLHLCNVSARHEASIKIKYHHIMEALKTALKTAVELYAQSLGCTIEQAIEFYQTSESTRECWQLMILCQADQSKLKDLAARFAA